MPLQEVIPVAFGASPQLNSPQKCLNAFTPPNVSAELNIKYRKLDPYTTGDINVLLLENISPTAIKIFKDAGFNVLRCLFVVMFIL